MWPTALVYIHFTLLAYAPKQICLQHCPGISHGTFNVGFTYSPNYCIHPLKVNNYKIYLPYYCKICYRNIYAPQLPYICQKFLNSLALIMSLGVLYTDIAGQWWWCRTTTMMKLQPNYIYWVGHLAKSITKIMPLFPICWEQIKTNISS